MFQKVIIVGNLGRDPEMRYTPDGRSVTTFTVATNETWTDNDGQRQKRTTWWRVTAWGRTAEACNEYLSKGRTVLVEGRLNPDPETGGPRVWTGRDGEPRASYELTALVVKFLGGRGGETVELGAEDEESDEADGPWGDDIPF